MGRSACSQICLSCRVRPYPLVSQQGSLQVNNLDSNFPPKKSAHFECPSAVFSQLHENLLLKRNEQMRSPSIGEPGMTKDRALWTGFMRSAEKFPDRPALLAEGKTLTYKELRKRACRIAATIQGHRDKSNTTLTAVFGHRSPTAFAGVLGSLLAGDGYVPLNRTFPVDQTQAMFARSECSAIVGDAGSLPQWNKLLEESHKALLILLPDIENVGPLKKQWPRHNFAGSNDLAPSRDWQGPGALPDAI